MASIACLNIKVDLFHYSLQIVFTKALVNLIIIINQTIMENRYVSVAEDKFKKTTTTESFSKEYLLTDTLDGLKETAVFSLRHVSSGTGNDEQSIVVDYSSLKKEKKNTYAGRRAMLYNGELILIINDNENISLKAINLLPDVTTKDFNGKEKVNYLIDKEMLDKISNANTAGTLRGDLSYLWQGHLVMLFIMKQSI